MINDMTVQERKVVEEAARRNVPTSEDSFFHYSDQDIWIEGFVAGAESALSELRKPSEDLVKQIEDIITDAFITDEEEESLLISYPEYHFKADELNSVCLKIAKLLRSPSCCQENDSELLGAAEKILPIAKK